MVLFYLQFFALLTQSYHLDKFMMDSFVFSNTKKLWHWYIKGFGFSFIHKSFKQNSKNLNGNVVVSFLKNIQKKTKVFSKVHAMKGGTIVWKTQRKQMIAFKTERYLSLIWKRSIEFLICPVSFISMLGSIEKKQEWNSVCLLLQDILFSACSSHCCNFQRSYEFSQTNRSATFHKGQGILLDNCKWQLFMPKMERLYWSWSACWLSSFCPVCIFTGFPPQVKCNNVQYDNFTANATQQFTLMSSWVCPSWKHL